MEKAVFIRKACDLGDLRRMAEKYDKKAEPYVIEKTVKLSKNEFDSLKCDFFMERTWITENLDKMWKDESWHCILATSKGEKIGILIESEGYDYARYSAVIEERRVKSTVQWTVDSQSSVSCGSFKKAEQDATTGSSEGSRKATNEAEEENE